MFDKCLITGGSLPSPVTSPDKTKGLRNDVLDKMYSGVQERTDRQVRVLQLVVFQSGEDVFSWRSTNNSR